MTYVYVINIQKASVVARLCCRKLCR